MNPPDTEITPPAKHHNFMSIMKIFGFGIFLPLLGSVLSVTAFHDWRFIHIEGHGLVEALGGLIALFMLLILYQNKHTLIDLGPLEKAWVGAALISMGILDIFHAIVMPGNNFVWFHSLATFLGGLFFAAIWTPAERLERAKRAIPWVATIIAVSLAALAFSYPQNMPSMLAEDGGFSLTARLLNILGGAGFIAAFAYFFKEFLHKNTRDDFYLASHCLLFGMAGILFELSVIWDAAWWWWHILRFAAYLVLLLFFLKALRATQKTKQTTIAIGNNVARYAIRFLSLVSLALGASVIAGWYLQNTTLIQVLPSFAPMQYNTALGFVFCGAALFCMTWNRNTLAMVFGGLASALGVLTLIQYISGFDFGIDQLFMDHYITTRTSHPGRMAPNTAICFALSGVAMMIGGLHRSAMFGFAIAVTMLAFSAFIGYLVGYDSLYGWGNLTRMAIHTTTGFFIVSFGLIIFSISKTERRQYDLWNLAPFSVSIILVVLSLFAWYVVEEEAQARDRAYFQGLVSDTQDALKTRYALYEESLYGGLGLFYASKSVERHEWKKYVAALNLNNKLPGINGIGYIDYILEDNIDQYLQHTRADDAPDFKIHPKTDYPDKFVIKFIEPIEKNIKALGLDIGFEANRREAAVRARDLGVSALTKKITLVQDNKKQAGFLLLIPVYDTKDTPPTVQDRRNHIQGWVYAPFIGPNFFSGIDKINKYQLHLEVYDGETTTPEHLIYANAESTSHKDEHRKVSEKTQLTFAGRTWTLLWHTNENYAPPAQKNLGFILLIFGLSFSALLYFALNRLLHSKTLIKKKVEEQTRELKEASKFQDLITNSIPDLIFVKDREFRIIDANHAFLNIYPEHARDKVIGSTTIESYSKENAEEFLKHDRQAFNEGYSEVEENITLPNGETRTLLTKKIRFENDNGYPFILGISRDVTDDKKAQETILRANEELERSNQELERFAYIASHDLQEPLRKIGGFTERLEKHLSEHIKGDEKAETYIDFITGGVERMRDLIMGLLEYSRVATADSDMEELDVSDVISIAIDNLSETIKDNGASITYDDMPTLQYDKIMMTQLFQNLIGNAIKYRSEEKPNFHISAKKSGDDWAFQIKDNGMGMEEQYLERIFEMFQRLHRKEDIGGTGIGLSLCQKIVERYGGKIWVTSEPGKGSSFFFTVPAYKN